MTLSKYNEVMDKVKVTDDMKKRILQNIEDTNFDDVKTFESVPKKEKKENKIISFVRTYGAVAAMFAVVLVGAYAVFGNMSGRKSMESATSEAPAATYEMAEETTEAAYADEEAATDEAAPIMGAQGGDAVNSAPMMEPSAMPAPAAPSKNDKTKDTAKNESVETEQDEMEVPSMVTEFASAKELSAEAGGTITDIDSLLNASTENHYLLYDSGMMEINYYIDGGNVYYRVASEEAASEYVNGDIAGDFIDYPTKTVRTINGVEVTLQGTETAFNAAGWEKDGVHYCLLHEKGLDDGAMTELLIEILGK